MKLALGPLLRRSGPQAVAVWVETRQPGTVTASVSLADSPGAAIHDFASNTFTIAGHHYAIVDLQDLELGRSYSYTLRLDDSVVWPEPSLPMPPSRFELWEQDTPFRVSGGSCRQQAPQDVRRAPDASSQESPISNELGADALAALAAEVLAGNRPLPHLLLLTGDQVYADEQHPVMTAELEDRRGGPPQEDWPQVTSFEEYTWLYQRTWKHRLVRWLLSCVPSLMIFDDHDVIDDWNISDTWARDIAQEPWWQDRLDAALMSYWVYQHLGNLSAEQRLADELFQAVRKADDGEAVLRTFAASVGTGAARYETSWSYRVEVGPIQVVVLDARNGRVLEPSERSMLSPRDWNFLDQALQQNPNVLVVSSVPWLLPPGVHNLERLVSRVVKGRWGPRAARGAEWIRRAIDLEHWAAFGRSVDELTDRLRQLARSPDRRYPPLVFSGDVHFGYLAAQRLSETACAYQLVSSPLRQGDANYEQVARWTAMTSAFDTTMRRLAAKGFRRSAPKAKHRVIDGVWTKNNIASLTYETDRLRVQLDHADLSEDGLTLRPLLVRTLD